MKPSLKEQLSAATLNYSAYGNLPERADVLAVKNKELLEQRDKVVYIRKNLQAVNNYLESTTDLSFNEWLTQNNITGVSTNVTNKIGKYNNDTGGISAYFLDLQNFHDEEEKIYDALEKTVIAPDSIREDMDALQKIRITKRKTRAEERKLILRDLEKDGKGYLNVEFEEEAPVTNQPDERVETKDADGATEYEKAALTPGSELTHVLPRSIKILGVVIIVIAGVCVTIKIIKDFNTTKTE